MTPLSVIVPTFNGSLWIERTLETLLRDPAEKEVLVVDDGSADDTIWRAARYPVRILRHDRNRGCAAALNTGLAEARGHWVTFLDHDDELEPGGLVSRLRWLQRHPEAGVVGGVVETVIDENGATLGSPGEAFGVPYDRPPGVLTGESLRAGARHFLTANLLMARRSLCRLVGGFDTGLRLSQDLDFILKLLQWQAIPFLPVSVYRYRLHGGNSSGSRTPAGFRFGPVTVAERTLVRLSHGIPQ